MLLVHHNCNPNDQENSHKLQIWTASSKNRKANFLSRTKTDSEIIQMVKRISTRARSNNCLYWWGEKFGSLNKKIDYKILQLHHGCNPKDQENSHKLKIWTASSKNRKMNFRLKGQWIHPDFDFVSHK